MWLLVTKPYIRFFRWNCEIYVVARKKDIHVLLTQHKQLIVDFLSHAFFTKKSNSNSNNNGPNIHKQIHADGTQHSSAMNLEKNRLLRSVNSTYTYTSTRIWISTWKIHTYSHFGHFCNVKCGHSERRTNFNKKKFIIMNCCFISFRLLNVSRMYIRK